MKCNICGENACYVCGRSGRPVCAKHARIEVVSRLSFGASDNLNVRELTAADREKAAGVLRHFHDGTRLTLFGRELDALELPGYIAEVGAGAAGILSYVLEGGAMLIELEVMPGYQGLGVGKKLLEAARSKAAEVGAASILAAVTNDDLSALYFYQKNGFRICEVAPDAVAARSGGVRAGFAGIPSRDELRLCAEV